MIELVIKGQLLEALEAEFKHRDESPDFVLLGSKHDLARKLLAEKLLELSREHDRG